MQSPCLFWLLCLLDPPTLYVGLGYSSAVSSVVKKLPFSSPDCAVRVVRGYLLPLPDNKKPVSLWGKDEVRMMNDELGRSRGRSLQSEFSHCGAETQRGIARGIKGGEKDC